jgi:hypothetical protein
VLKSALDALDSLGRPAIVLDRPGFVLEANREADTLFDTEIFIRNRRLILADALARQKLDKWIQQLATVSDFDSLAPEQLVVRRSRKASVLIRRLSVSATARGPFLRARALLVLSDLASNPVPHPSNSPGSSNLPLRKVGSQFHLHREIGSNFVMSNSESPGAP